VELSGHITNTAAELHAARQALDSGSISDAFQRLNKLKQRRVRHRGVDYLRALCFVEMGQRDAAIEAAKEELRFFDTKKASLLLEWLLPYVHRQSSNRDEEFTRLFKAIRPFTMVGEPRLWSLFTLARSICVEDVPGDFVECGVAAGGSSALLAAVIRRHSKRERRLFAFDTFEGMPAPSALDTHGGRAANETGWGTGTCAAAETSLQEICRILDVNDIVQPVKGLFADTLPRISGRPIAMLHMDGDWYRSTLDILENLYDSVVPGGFIQVDDYGHWEGCRRAVHEFFETHSLSPSLETIDYGGVWLRK